MDIIIILRYKENNQTYENYFLNGEYCDLDLTDRLERSIVETIDLDSYLTKDEQAIFFDIDNCEITYQEQEAILNGEIDYAFDMIKDRINENKNKEVNFLLHHTALELERYQDMIQEVLDYIVEHQEIKEVNDIYDIIKKWAC